MAATEQITVQLKRLSTSMSPVFRRQAVFGLFQLLRRPAITNDTVVDAVLTCLTQSHQARAQGAQFQHGRRIVHWHVCATECSLQESGRVFFTHVYV